MPINTWTDKPYVYYVVVIIKSSLVTPNPRKKEVELSSKQCLEKYC